MEQVQGQQAAAVTARPPTPLASAVSLPPPTAGSNRPTPMPSPSRCAVAFLTHPPAVGPSTCASSASPTAPPPAVITPAAAASGSIPEMGAVAAGVTPPPCGRRMLPRLAPRPVVLPVRTGDGGTSSCDSGIASGRSAAGVATPSVAPCAVACGAPPAIALAATSASQVASRVPVAPSSICSTGDPSLRGASPPAAAPVPRPASPRSGSIGSSAPSPVSSPALGGVPPAPPSASASGGDGEAGGPARRRRRRGSRVEKDTPPRELRRVLRNRELARVSNEKRRVRLACMQGEMDALRAAVAAAAAERDATAAQRDAVAVQRDTAAAERDEALARVADLEAALVRQGGGRVSPPPTSAPMAPAVATPLAGGGEAPARVLPLPPPPLSAPPLPPQQPLSAAGMGAGYPFRPPLGPTQWPSASVSVAPARAGAHMLLQAAAVEMA